MELIAQKREIFGKKTKNLRKEGFIPAELYGYGVKNLHLMVKTTDFERAFDEAGKNIIINLMVDGAFHSVLIYDYQNDYLTGKFLNIDFYEVRMDEKINTSVPIEFIGEAPAVKEKDAILVKTMNEVQVEALPQNLPSKLVADLGVLMEIGQSLFIKDIKTKGDFEILVDSETVIATASEMMPEEDIKPAVAVGEVIAETDLKKTERELRKKEVENLNL